MIVRARGNSYKIFMHLKTEETTSQVCVSQ